MELHKRKPCSEERRKKISKALKGRLFSVETRKKISDALKGKKNALGKTFSKETRRKMSEARKGMVLSEEHRRKISDGLKGKSRLPLSEEHIKKIRETLKGRPISDEARKKRNGRQLSEEHRKNIGKATKKRFSFEENRKKISEIMKEKFCSDEMRRKWSEAKKGEKSYRWKGGITSENATIRKNIEYRLWREAVFARDNWTCQDCGERGGRLQAHHIKPFAKFPELRTSIENGITLCKECHKKIGKQIK